MILFYMASFLSTQLSANTPNRVRFFLRGRRRPILWASETARRKELKERVYRATHNDYAAVEETQSHPNLVRFFAPDPIFYPLYERLSKILHEWRCLYCQSHESVI